MTSTTTITTWTNSAILEKANWLLSQAKTPFDLKLDEASFPEYASTVADVVRHAMTAKQRSELEWLTEWSEQFAKLYGDWSRALKADPLLAYRPKTATHEAFHNSLAYWRYAMCANGTGKTTMAYAENWAIATGSALLGIPRDRGNVAVISTGFGGYAETVFERKMLNGEDGNPFAPAFPEDGYWFHSYDQKLYTLHLACPTCAHAKRPKTCAHTVSIKCFSDASGWERFQGGSYKMVHIDEHVSREWYDEAIQRTRRGGVNGRGMVTGTPLFGEDEWEITDLLRRWEGKPEDNLANTDDPTGPPYVQAFSISQYEAGIIPKGEIESNSKKMSRAMYRARVLGLPTPMAMNPVFDLHKLDSYDSHCSDPLKFGKFYPNLNPAEENSLFTPEEILSSNEFQLMEDYPDDLRAYSGIRIWEAPVPTARYLLSVDTALGLAQGVEVRDPSCADVWKMEPRPNGEIKLHQVAQLHGWIDPFEFADQVKMMAIYYNYGAVIPENTGASMALVGRLTRQLLYPNVYRDPRSPEYADYADGARMGVDTNKHTKPLMVAAAQKLVNKDLVIFREKNTLKEMRAFEQEKTDLGNPRYRGAGGAKDDRVMSFCIAAYPLSIDAGSIWELSGVSLEPPKATGERPWYLPDPNPVTY